MPNGMAGQVEIFWPTFALLGTKYISPLGANTPPRYAKLVVYTSE